MEDKISKILNGEIDVDIELKAVLPPSKSLAQIIASFANTNDGYLILGATKVNNKIKTIGLGSDFYANDITIKALNLLSPKLSTVSFDHVALHDKRLFVIHIQKSEVPILVENKKYIRNNGVTLLEFSESIEQYDGHEIIKQIAYELLKSKSTGTSSKQAFINHFLSILKLFSSLSPILYPKNPNTPTDIIEGKLMCRILFSSFVDNFEGYLADLLYEVFLAKPDSLKSDVKTVTIKEVLECPSIEDFVKFIANKEMKNLQRGSVRSFLKQNQQIGKLKAISNDEIDDVEKVLQIRHLYTHKNGIADEKFLNYYSDSRINCEYQMSIKTICDKFIYLFDIVEKIDIKAIDKYNLS